MATRGCVSCGKTVNRDVTSCPYCGADPRTGAMPESARRLEERFEDQEAPSASPAEPFFGRPAREVPPALSSWLRRWRGVLAIAFLTGCASAIVVWAIADATSWGGTAQAAWFMAGLAGVLVGARLTYSGRPAARAPHETRRVADETTAWSRLRCRVSAAPRPVLGAAIALFSAPVFIASLLA